MKSRRRMVLVACLCLAWAGCSGSGRPPLGTVEGTVTLDGRPLAEAIVVFRPEQPGRLSQATTDAAGHYELSYLGDVAGAPLGRHVVRIITASVENGGRERLPDRYHRSSTLSADVKSGRNTVNFDLTSK